MDWLKKDIWSGLRRGFVASLIVKLSPLAAPLIAAGLAVLVGGIAAFQSWIINANPHPVSILVVLGAAVLVVWPASLMLKHRRAIEIFVRRSGVRLWPSTPVLPVNSSKQMVGSSRDLVIWGPISHRVMGAYFEGYNFSSTPISDVAVLLRSLQTGEEIEGYLDGMHPQETYGIPGRCHFRAFVRFMGDGAKEGLTPEDFERYIGGFEFVFRHDGKEKKKRYSIRQARELVKDQTDRVLPPRDHSVPRVAKKELSQA